jgi:hypothetical protein
MAGLQRLRNIMAAEPPDEITVPRLADDLEFAAESDRGRAFTVRLERLKTERNGRILEYQLSGRQANPKSTSDTDLRTRLAAFLRLPPIESTSTTVPTADPSESPAIQAALQVLNGKTPPPVLDHAARLAVLDREIAALELGIRAQNEIVDDLADTLTLKYAQQLKPAWDRLQVEMFRAAQELSRAAGRIQNLRARIVQAGIKSRSDILATPNVRAPLQLGTETEWGSELSTWRRLLEQWGLV